jgi:glutamine synthetase
MPQTPQEVLNLIREKDIKIIDLKFIDMPGIWQHCSFYKDLIDEDAFTEGVALMDRVFAVGKPSTNPICPWFQIPQLLGSTPSTKNRP